MSNKKYLVDAIIYLIIYIAFTILVKDLNVLLFVTGFITCYFLWCLEDYIKERKDK